MNQPQGIQVGMAFLKNYYQGPVADQFNEEMPVARAVERDKNSWSGLQVVRPLRVRRNQGVGATSDGGILPAIGKQTGAQAIIPAKFNYLRFGITGPMIKASKSDIGSFLRMGAYELEMGYKDLKSDMNRQFSWNGTGTLATVNANTAGSTTLVIAGRESVEAALKFVDYDLVFDIVAAASSTVIATGIQVTGVSGTPSGATATLTLSAPVTCSAGDLLIRSGSFGNELQGLLTALDGASSTAFNINRALYPVYQGNVLNRNGQQLTLDFLQQLYNEALRRGGAKLSAHLVDFDTQRMYQKLLTADKRYENTTKGDGGFANKDQNYLEFNGIPVVADKDMPQRWMTLDATSWKLYVLSEMEFADETGSMWIAQQSGDVLEARVRYFANLFPEQPNANAVGSNYVSP